MAALEIARAYYPPALLNHCVRSFYFADDDGQRRGLEVDRELLFVSSMLHDIGLVPTFDSAAVPFELAGGHVAQVFTWGAGWSDERRRRVAEVIERHMWDEVDPAVDPEGHLLARATSLDISGRGAGDWPEDFLMQVLRAYPRLDLTEAFATCFDEQSVRKPDSAAGRAARSGMRGRLERNPLNDLQI